MSELLADTSATQWIIAVASLGSALIALALAFGLKEWLFRPRVRLLLRQRDDPDEISDRVVTKRIDTGENAAFVRVRLENTGRSTARNVGVRLLQVHRWNETCEDWERMRPELDGRLLQPSNQLPNEPATVDVFPYSDRIVDLASVGYGKEADNGSPIFVEISHPWPPNEANVLEPGRWQLEVLVCGDNINARRYYLGLSFDGRWHETESEHIWDHFVVEEPSARRLPGGGSTS